MKIVFFGTSNFALPILEALVSKHDVAAVVTSPDAPVGRKREFSESPVSALATDLKLKTLKPASLKGNDLFRLELADLKADMFVVAAYGRIIPKDIIELPPHKTLNVHPSKLPKYRGASPIQYALLNGDTETGISIMQIDEEMDHGPILTMEKAAIDSDDNFITLSDRLARASAKLLLAVLDEYANGRLTLKEQDHKSASFTKIITKQDGKVDWNKTGQEIFNQFRAFYPWPGLWTTWNGKKIKITGCSLSDLNFPDQQPGTVNANGVVVCGKDTAVEISRLQMEGKNEAGILDFLNGYPQIIGSKLE